MDKQLQAEQEKVESILSKIPRLKKEIHKVIIGQEEVLDQLIVGLIGSGHVLLEGVPGLAKTLMIKTLAEALDLDFKRIQFTPDLMPSDVLGTEVLQLDGDGNKYFKYHPGPIFANLVLADEINRTPPKTQSALLEIMQEYAVTYGGKNYPLPKPFFLLATQNPIEQSGTFSLPEAQVDRFLLYVKVGYPGEREEANILAQTTSPTVSKVQPVLNGSEVIELQSLCRQVTISPELISAINKRIRNSRPQISSSEAIREYVAWGAGPRAGQSLIIAAKAHALMQGRYAVTPNDIKAMLMPALQHRILLNYKAVAEGISVADIIQDNLAIQ